jgi:hypothetical protein
MMGPNYVDDIDCGSFFDHIDDLIDFPSDEAPFGSGSASGNAFCDNFPSVWTGPSDDLTGSEPFFPGCNSNSASDLSAELAVPYEDIVQLEWLSTFVEDSFAGKGMTINTTKLESTQSHFQTSSPVSVLESSSSSSCSGGHSVGGSGKTIPQRGARSKRPRPPTFKPRAAMHLKNSPTSSMTDSGNFSDSGDFVMIQKPAGVEHKKKKKMKAADHQDSDKPENNSQQSVRKCMHCEITKTPQWRAGPMGPKSLCNACGVRYKSGRLFPEYRPAASPTFVPALHSNSHKKVVEMRIKGVGCGSGSEEQVEAK